MSALRVAVVGAGVTGRTHVEALGRLDLLALAAIVDAASAALAGARDVPLFADVDALLAAGLPDAAVVAPPNHTHVPVATTLLEAGLPVLVALSAAAPAGADREAAP